MGGRNLLFPIVSQAPVLYKDRVLINFNVKEPYDAQPSE